VGVLLGQQFGDGFTNATAGAGDEGDPAVESSIDFIPYLTLIRKFRAFIALSSS